MPKQDADGSQTLTNGTQVVNSNPQENATSRSSEGMDSLDSSMICAGKKEGKEMKNSPRLPVIQVQLQPQGDKTLAAKGDGTAGAFGGMETRNSLDTETGSALSSSFVGQAGLNSSYKMKNSIVPAPLSIVNSSAGSQRKEPGAVNSALQSIADRSPQPQQHLLSALTQVNGGARIGNLSPKNQAKNELSPQLKDLSPNSSRVITSQSLLRALNLTPSLSPPHASDVYPREASTDPKSQLKKGKCCEVLVR